ncbi:GTP pyrophosphokinase [Gallicola sp. Sow4_E12]|uniref:GTP pyrophosphokinase n=1 Tax=Gallicola sp. Sow4_E12 TaxID=3438785 RepID=UPI003F8FB5E4
MKLGVFEFVDKASAVIEEKNNEVKLASRYLRTFFMELLKGREELISIRYRIKSRESIKEKILRQNYYLRCTEPEDILNIMPDIIGIRIECRFNDDEGEIFDEIRQLFNQTEDSTWYYTKKEKDILLDLRALQPQYQQNGFEIYKIDGKYTYHGMTINFELQIKSMVNVFWGDIEHRILYKNFNFMMREEFLRDLMYSIKYNLTMIDNQLFTIYEKLHSLGTSRIDSTKDQFKQMVSQMIHDIYSIQIMERLGVVMDLRDIIHLVVDYLFAKIQFSKPDSFDREVIHILNRLTVIANSDSTFGEKIVVGKIEYNHRILRQFGEGLSDKINEDFRWNLVLAMIMDICEGTVEEEIRVFSEFVVFTVVYRVRNIIKTLHLSEKDKEELVWTFTQMIFHYYCKDYHIQYFTIESMRNLENALRVFLRDVYVPEELLALDLTDFYDLLDEYYISNSIHKGELE